MKFAVLLVLLVGLAGCSSDGDEAPNPAAVTTSLSPSSRPNNADTTVPAIVRSQGWTDTKTTTFEGKPIWYSKEAELIYAADCDTADRAGDGTGADYSGFGHICPS